MRSTASLAISLIMALVVVGCDLTPYVIHEDKLGRQIRLNRWTGELSVLEGDTLIKLGRSVTYSGPLSREWPAISLGQLGDVSATLRTSWHDGRLRYSFSLSPESKKLKDATAQVYGLGKSFTVLLTDAFGIAVAQGEVALTSMSRVVDDKGSPTGLNHNGEVPCSYGDYLLIAGWNVLWRL